ncbi:MAG: HPF/RaiA family ribosome-associated protein, partial [Candidatus Rokubacteria bacterium]|nr:HPF/RaiA family ribosome-associated protein [Candidatus Rokubacteria bacterium]
LRTHVTRQLGAALARLSVKPVAAQVRFRDENGPKGGIDIRCALTVRLPYRPAVRVEDMGDTHRLAFDQAFAILERQLERYAERGRESRRRPKKYFVAKRLFGGEAPAPETRTARTARGGG